ncbi:hypothetical protein [Clostridioides sp. ZZV15-6598]|nr:hypothetical protein [Clostridioides sp. ZZV15-6598]
MDIEYKDLNESSDFSEFVNFMLYIKENNKDDFLYIKGVLYELEKEDR